MSEKNDPIPADAIQPQTQDTPNQQPRLGLVRRAWSGWKERRQLNAAEREENDRIMYGSARENFAAELKDVSLPDERKEMNYGDVSFHYLPLNLDGITNFGREVNRLKETRIDKHQVVESLRPDPNVYVGIPIVASYIVRKLRPDLNVPQLFPNHEEMRHIKPWLYDVSTTLGMFSKGWEERFLKVVETKGRKKVEDEISKKLDPFVKLAEVQNPQEQFVDDLKTFYQRTMYLHTEGAGKHPYDRASTASDALVSAVEEGENLIEGGHRLGIGDGRRQYPLFEAIFPLVGDKVLDALATDELYYGAPELWRGIQYFLHTNKKGGLYPIPAAYRETSVFDPLSWDIDNFIREGAETYHGHQLQELVRTMPKLLEEVKGILPTNGPEFMKAIENWALNVLILSKRGVSNEILADALFYNPDKPSERYPK